MVWGSAATWCCSTFIIWTRWTLTMTIIMIALPLCRSFYLNSSLTFSSPLSLLSSIIPYSPHTLFRFNSFFSFLFLLLFYMFVLSLFDVIMFGAPELWWWGALANLWIWFDLIWALLTWVVRYNNYHCPYVVDSAVHCKGVYVCFLIGECCRVCNLFTSHFISAIAAVLFAVHPVHTEAVSMITQDDTEKMGRLFSRIIWEIERAYFSIYNWFSFIFIV